MMDKSQLLPGVDANRRRLVRNLAAAGVLLPLAPINALFAAPPARPVCVFSKHLHWLEIPEMARTAAALGFDGVDLTVRKDGHISPERAAAELPGAIATIRKAGLEVPMITTDLIDPASPLTVAVLQAAARSGVKFYRTAWVEYDPQLGVERTLDKLKVQFRALAALNKKLGITGVYQNHAGTSVGSAVWDLWVLLKDIDPQWLGVQYDPKHAIAEGGQSWVHDLDLLRRHIRCLDIKDFFWEKKGEKWQHQLVPLGQGMVDYQKVFGLVKQYNISGPLSLHYEYPLGGADTGQKQLSVDREVVLAAMRRDLQTLRGMLRAAGLS